MLRVTPGSPSVLLVTLDTTRRDHFGCYGDTRGLTPNLDALAAEGVRFASAYSTAASTPTAHASILSGLNPYQHGLRVIAGAGGYRLRPDAATLSTTLQAAGWATGAFLSSFTVSEHYGLQRGFSHWDNGLAGGSKGVLRDDPQTRLTTWDVEKHQRRSDDTTDAFLAWLETTRGPFFAWVHYWDPHDTALLPPLPVQERFPAPRSSSVPERMRALYAAEVAFVDEQFGRVLQRLKSNGLYDKTMIAVIADHGEGLGDHDWWRHRLLYQEQICVPFLLRLPGGPRGLEVKEIVRCTDLFPTLLDYLGAEAPAGLFGRTLRPLLSATGDASRLAYADQLNKLDLNSNMARQRPRDGLLYSVIEGDWKLIFNDEHVEASQLYNLKEDPGERDNRFLRDSDKARELRARLEALQPFQRSNFEPIVDAAGAAAERALGALGYLGSAEGEEPGSLDTQPVETP